MDEKAAEETQELLEVTNQEQEPEPSEEQVIPDPPETVVGLVHEQGAIAATVTNLCGDVDDLRNQISTLRSEIAGVARVEAQHLLDTILEEAQSGEAEEEHAEEATASHGKTWWSRLLAGD